MKHPRSAAALLAALLLAATASAASSLPTTSTIPASIRPVPIEIVHPTGLPSRFKDATVKVMLTIDETGRVHDLAPASRMPDDLASRLLPAIAQWRFNPMQENGRAVRVRVLLPLTLTEEA